MRKEDLIKELSKLNNALIELETERAARRKFDNDTRDLVEFLLEHDRDEIVTVMNWISLTGPYYTFKYIHNKILKTFKTTIPAWNNNVCTTVEIVQNNKDNAILKLHDRYYKLIKVSETLIEIPKPAFVVKSKELQE